MLKRFPKRALAGAVFSCLLFSACASADKNLTIKTYADSRRFLASGDYDKALDGFREAHRTNPRGKELTAKYILTIEDIKRTADGVRAQRDYVRAGNIYRILLDRYGDFRMFAARLTFKRADLEAALKECRIAAVDDPAAQAVRAGNFAKAIDIFWAALKKDPGDVELSAEYRAAINQIKAAGDKAFAGEDFAEAGRVHALLLRNSSSFAGLRLPVTFGQKNLEDVVAACRENLTITGLAEYRKGNLAKAVALWEGLLSFDPDNTEIKKAVETAKTQLDAIKKKTRGEH